MQNAMLLRRAFQPSVVEESWDASLLEQAAKLVGYRPSAVAQRELAHKRSLDENIFARALERLDIQPFTVQSVQAYKAQMLREALRDQSWSLTRYMHQSGAHEMKKGQTVVHAVGWPSAVVFAATSIATLVLHFCGEQSWGWDGHKSVQIIHYLPWEGVRFAMGVMAIPLAAWGALMFLRYKKATQMTASWNIRGLEPSRNQYNDYVAGYTEPIPAFAVQRMLSLKQELPEVTFSVEQLNAEKTDLNTQHRVKLPPDPFLIATFRGISAYVDVWDEPAFEGRRTI